MEPTGIQPVTSCVHSVRHGLSQLRARLHIAILMPRLTSQTFAGQEVKNPTIIPIYIRNQKAAEPGIS
jgi:hypothetical protein